MSSLSDQRTEVLELLGIPDGDPFWPTAKLNRFINRALRQISTAHDWPWLQVEATIPLVQGTRDYAVPADWRKTLSLTINGDDLDYFSKRASVKYRQYDTQRPVIYTYQAGNLQFLPVPGTSGLSDEHLYIRHEPLLVADVDVPLLPDAYSDYLSVTAAKRAAASMGDTERMATMTMMQDDWIKIIRDDIRPTRANPRVRARDDWRVNV